MQADQLRDVFRIRLRAVRKRNKMSQNALAQAIDSNQPYISALENGEFSPTFEMLARLSEALGVNPDYFLRPERVSA